jgi:hypothetical protein
MSYKQTEEISALLAAKMAQEGKPATQALESRCYKDPSTFVKFANEPEAVELKTKEIEDILHAELDNWRRWCLQRDYMPQKGRDSLNITPSATAGKEIDILQAEKMERVAASMPPRLRDVFKAHHLNKVVCGNRSVIVVDVKRKYQLLGMNPRTYQRINSDAHRCVLRAVKKYF